MSGLPPTPPLEDTKSLRKSSSKHGSKPSSRSSKKSSSSHEHGAVIIDGRHKRVWKACERCRLKKTKCDGESPCKRCKDDGLVCTAGSRKKTEFKQLPRGYAEVLENTQYALIATIQKLYTMVRNNESWDLGDPEMNDRGQPVIHDIASRLGCIRPSPDLPYAFPEGADGFAELQAQLAARSDLHEEDSGSRKTSEESSSYSPTLERTDRASSSESDHSILSKTSNQIAWDQHQREAKIPNTSNAKIHTATKKPTPLRASFDDETDYPTRTSFETATTASIPSPMYTDFTESPMFSNTSPFPSWSQGDDYLATPQAFELTAHYMRQARLQSVHQPLQSMGPVKRDPEIMRDLPGELLADGTIRPNMLDYQGTYDIYDPMDNIMFNAEYETHMI